MTVRLEAFATVPQLRLVSHSHVLPQAVARDVDAIWEEELAARGSSLYDGTLISVKNRVEALWECEIVSYRRLVASLRKPELAAAMGFHGLGVTGCVTCQDGYVLGRRGSATVQEAGYWEFAPAGGLDADDVKGGSVSPLSAFEREWIEETGAPFKPLSGPRIAGFVTNGQGNVSDLVVCCEMPFASDELLRYYAGLEHREYSEIKIVPSGKLAGFQHELAEVSGAICEAIISGNMGADTDTTS